MQIIIRNLDELIPYAKNSRKHSSKQIKQLAASLQEFGWTNPILIDGNSGIIAGHGRILAAKKLSDQGLSIPRWIDTNSVPTIELAHLTTEQARAYAIADNRLASISTWDTEILGEELTYLSSANFDIEIIGFEDLIESKLVIPDGYEFRVIVDCTDESDQQALMMEFEGRGLTCRPLTS